KKATAFVNWQNHRGTNLEIEYANKYKRLRKLAKIKIDKCQKEYWDEICEEIESSIKLNDPANAFNIIRRLSGKRKRVENMPIKDKHGKLILNSTDQLERWKEFFDGLLNVPSAVDPQLIDQIKIKRIEKKEEERQNVQPTIPELQRSTISQRQRPIEASLRNRLLVWRFLKKIENEPVSTIINSEQQLLTNNDSNNSSWILDLNENCDSNEIDMDIDSDIVTVVSNNETNDSTCDTMDIEQETDVTLLLKRAIGAERRQKISTENLILNENNNHNNNNNNNNHLSETTTLEETEQFFHDLCAELTNTTAALVSSSSTNSLRCPTPSEQALIH
ncbi:unnamed protein product, partial [Rotaria sp. Silwood2]